MFDAIQRKRLKAIEVTNVVNDTSLLSLSLEEMSEFQLACAKISMGEDDFNHLLEEGVDCMITIYNFLQNSFKYDEIEKMVNAKIKKAENILKIGE